MKPAALLMAVGGGIAAVAIGVFVFADQLGFGPKTAPEKPAATSVAAPVKTTPESAAPASKAAEKPKAEEKPATVAVTPAADPKPEEAKVEPKTSEPVEKPEVVVEREEPKAPAPSFDVVRVEPTGETLVAGKASPGWQVELKNGDKVIARAEADINGDWVMILEEALDKGVSDLSLSAMSKDGTTSVASTSNVTVALPEDGSGELLVIETAPGEASKVIAKLAQPKAEPETEQPVTAQPTEPEKKPEEPKQVAQVATEPEQTADAEKTEAPVAPAKPEAKQEDPSGAPSSEVVKDRIEQAADALTATEEKPTKEVKPEAEPETQPKAETVAETAEIAEAKPEPVESKPEAKEPEPKPVKTVVSIEAVEIEGDVVFIAGAAEPAGSIVRLYVNNKPVSDQRSGETGRYLFDGKLKLAPGEHRARVDLLDTRNGDVAKRAEVIFTKKAPQPVAAESKPAAPVKEEAKPAESASATPAASSEASAEPTTPQVVQTKKVIIRRGDNLWEIARRVYGAGIRYSTIYDSNTDQIRNPNLIYPGQVFELPEGEENWEHNFDAVESPPVEGADLTDAPSSNGN